MSVVWKYDINPDVNIIDMPQGARMFSVAAQRDEVKLWAFIVNESAPLEQHKFICVGTGIPFEVQPGESITHVGTALLFGGGIVLHVFEAMEAF